MDETDSNASNEEWMRSLRRLHAVVDGLSLQVSEGVASDDGELTEFPPQTSQAVDDTREMIEEYMDGLPLVRQNAFYHSTGDPTEPEEQQVREVSQSQVRENSPSPDRTHRY